MVQALAPSLQIQLRDKVPRNALECGLSACSSSHWMDSRLLTLAYPSTGICRPLGINQWMEELCLLVFNFAFQINKSLKRPKWLFKSWVLVLFGFNPFELAVEIQKSHFMKFIYHITEALFSFILFIIHPPSPPPSYFPSFLLLLYCNRYLKFICVLSWKGVSCRRGLTWGSSETLGGRTTQFS